MKLFIVFIKKWNNQNYASYFTGNRAKYYLIGITHLNDDLTWLNNNTVKTIYILFFFVIGDLNIFLNISLFSCSLKKVTNLLS